MRNGSIPAGLSIKSLTDAKVREMPTDKIATGGVEVLLKAVRRWSRPISAFSKVGLLEIWRKITLRERVKLIDQLAGDVWLANRSRTRTK